MQVEYKTTLKQREYSRTYRLTHKEEIKKSQRQYGLSHRKEINESRRKRILWYKELRESLFRIKCGESHIACLDFHHRDPKEKDCAISVAISKYSKQRVLEEISKCDVMCKNCHSKYHWEENGGN
jgi:hypothetical protein